MLADSVHKSLVKHQFLYKVVIIEFATMISPHIATTILPLYGFGIGSKKCC